MTIHTCKTCGRAIKSEIKPNFCHFDRTTSLENIGEEDAVKMGLFSTTEGIEVSVSDNQSIVIEFYNDLRYDPFDGSKIYAKQREDGKTLVDFQMNMLGKVVENE